MTLRNTLATALTMSALIFTTGCAVTRGQESVGAYIDDSAISVETLNGTVMLSGFAKSTKERSTAESITWRVGGVKLVKNEIAIRP